MPRSHLSLIATLAGPLLGLLVGLLFPETDTPLAGPTAGVAVWMAVWWLFEAVPLAVTSLLPLVLFPVLGVMPSGEVAGQYTNDVIFLFLGGFLVALAMERWELHRRIALVILRAIGGGPARTLLGFMAATALLSMWISNTATAMMMVPIAGAVLSQYDRSLDHSSARRLGIGLMLGIAYAASIGGMATLVGTPPNLAFTRLFEQAFPTGPTPSFGEWMAFALPLSLGFLVVAWGVLVGMYTKGLSPAGATSGGDIDLGDTDENGEGSPGMKAGGTIDAEESSGDKPRGQARTDRGSSRERRSSRAIYAAELRALGPMKREERIVLVVFLTLAALWITRKPLELGTLTVPGWSLLLPEPGYAGDGLPAMALAILLFLLPAREQGQRVLDWATARKLPWGIVLLFGGGFALAAAIQSSGLAGWIGEQLAGLGNLPPVVMVGSISTLMTFTTELTSNTATTQLVLPVLAAVAVAIERNPFLLMIPATLSASCAFMMPVATPPNAIVFGSGRLRVADMARTGLVLNLIGVLLITGWLMLAGPSHFGEMSHTPEWSETTAAP